MPLTVKIEAESLLRTLAIRRPLEIEAVRHAARNGPARAKKLIIARVAELMAVYEAGEDWRPADHRFHTAIHNASGNPLFGQIIGQLQQAFNSIYAAPFGKPHLGRETVPAHKPMAEAIEAGDEAEAGRLMARIMDMLEKEVRSEMESKND